jgi:hypothetical protein
MISSLLGLVSLIPIGNPDGCLLSIQTSVQDLGKKLIKEERRRKEASLSNRQADREDQ